MKFVLKCAALGAILACATPLFAQPAGKAAAPAAAGSLAGQTVRIAFMDPLSGPFANVGQNQLKSWQFAAEHFSGAKNPAGVKFEVVGFDNKGSPQESLNTLKAAADQGFRYITQGNGSGAGLAIEDAVQKYNERNPGKELIYFNYAAVDPALTNAKCSFWHFRWDANSDIKMEALTNYMKTTPAIKNVYLINQDYSFGESVRSTAKAMLAAKRPDIKIVGDELHPLLKITD
ncbi:MAG TPA: ABC transporter substrate-binding protein, partial [Ramlibacter sp.]|nr:ABC transporter substrate-binding protein [Ramlibacter sp.]